MDCDARTMEGMTVMVTGASSGLGKAATGLMAHLGARLVMVYRDAGRCLVAMEEIWSDNEEADLEMMEADLSSQTQVRSLARRFREGHDRLDVLVNNAATIPRRWEVTADGVELQLAVNHMAPFLLTNLLEDMLLASSPSRVVVVASEMHRLVSLDPARINERGPAYVPWLRYSRTKLANLLFTRGLDRRLEGSGVTVNAIHPGMVATDLAREYGEAVQGLYDTLARTPEDGAMTIVHAASSPRLGGVSGMYLVDCREAPPSRDAMDGELAEGLWRASMDLAGGTLEGPGGGT